MVSQNVEQLRQRLVVSIEGAEPSRANDVRPLDDTVRAVEGTPRREKPSKAVCASYEREERLQYRFMVFFQTLIATLGLLALLLLIWAVYLIVKEDSDGVNAALAGLGAIVTSAGALFLLNQRKDARDAHEAAQLALSACSE